MTLAGNLVAFAREGFRWIVGRDAATLSAEAPLGHAEPTNAETGFAPGQNARWKPEVRSSPSPRTPAWPSSTPPRRSSPGEADLARPHLRLTRRWPLATLANCRPCRRTTWAAGLGSKTPGTARLSSRRKRRQPMLLPPHPAWPGPLEKEQRLTDAAPFGQPLALVGGPEGDEPVLPPGQLPPPWARQRSRALAPGALGWDGLISELANMYLFHFLQFRSAGLQ